MRVATHDAAHNVAAPQDGGRAAGEIAA